MCHTFLTPESYSPEKVVAFVEVSCFAVCKDAVAHLEKERKKLEVDGTNKAIHTTRKEQK